MMMKKKKKMSSRDDRDGEESNNDDAIKRGIEVTPQSQHKKSTAKPTRLPLHLAPMKDALDVRFRIVVYEILYITEYI